MKNLNETLIKKHVGKLQDDINEVLIDFASKNDLPATAILDLIKASNKIHGMAGSTFGLILIDTLIENSKAPENKGREGQNNDDKTGAD